MHTVNILLTVRQVWNTMRTNVYINIINSVITTGTT